MYVLSRKDNFAKLFFLVCFTGLFIYIILVFYTFHSAWETIARTNRVQKKIQSLPDPDFPPYRDAKNEKPKYILLWTKYGSPMKEGQQPFIDYDCLHQNCYITADKNLLQVDSYDAIIFNVTEMRRWLKNDIPSVRSPLQKYVFFGKESSYDAPVCNPLADDFFNWTWSYKLYSDIVSPFIEVKDFNGNIVAPNIEVVWNKKIPHEPLVNMKPWQPKNKAVACVLKNCGTSGKETLHVVKRLQSIFNKEKMIFDIYGCKHRECPNGDCLRAIKKDYYFYFAHELSLAEDFVTDEVMMAYDAGVVPIVYGGADYTKFLPPSSYINARTITAESLVAMIYYAIKNPTVYKGFFRWKKFYTIHRTPTYHGLCQLCSFLNNRMLMERNSHYELLRRWWYTGALDQRCLKIGAQNVSTTLSYLNESRGL